MQLRLRGVASFVALAGLAASPLLFRPALADGPEAKKDETKKGEDTALGLAGDVKVDEFNDSVKDKKHGDGKPVRGGMLRIGTPSDPKSICSLLENDQQTQIVFGYIYDSLINRDTETFEWLPMCGRWWKTRDIVVLKDGRRLEGRTQSEDEKKVVFAEGASKWTIARCELEGDVKDGDAKVTWKKGCGEGSIDGKVSSWPGGRYTVWVEERPHAAGGTTSATAGTIEIPQSDIAQIEEETDGKKSIVSGLIRDCVYEFKIRQGIKWQDGEPFKVDDIVWSYQTMMNPDVLSASIRSYFAETMNSDVNKAVVKLSDDMVRFELKKQYFAAVGVIGGVYILPSHRYKAEKFKGDPKGFAEYFNKTDEHFHPVGNGAYKFSAWERGKILELVRNEDWWPTKANVPWIDPLQPYLDKIQWIPINNKNARLKALRNNEIDVDFDIEQLTWVDKETNTADFTKDFVRSKYLGPPYTYIGWNCRNPDGSPHKIFSDPKVRLAMTMLIDRQKILDNIHFGLGEMVTGPFFQHGPFCDQSIKPVEYNPERAKTLLDEAGWIDHDGDGIRDKDGQPFEIKSCIHNARDYHLKIAEIVKQDLEKAGIKVDIKTTDFNTFIETVNSRKFDAIRFAWGEPDCVDTDPYQIWHSSSWANQGSNHTGYSNPEVDEILVRARRELDFKKRQRMFKKLHRILAEEQPYTFLFNLYELYFYNRKFRNVKLYVLGTTPYNLDEWYIPKELQGDKK